MSDGFVTAGGHRLEIKWVYPSPSMGEGRNAERQQRISGGGDIDPDSPITPTRSKPMASRDLPHRGGGDKKIPTLIFLHEGLGSVALWRDFPDRLAAATGAPAVVYSRYGYGKSDRLAGERSVDYMHVEALTVLPELRSALRLENVVLVGHSDGASIALIHAARWPVRGLILEAPHVFVEDVTIASIAEAKRAYETTDLGKRLARYHDDPDGAFWGWNRIWLHPDFRAWKIEDVLPGVRCPVLAIQGADDEYGTLAQLDAVQRGVAGPFERIVLPACGHAPHRDQEAATLAAMTRWWQNPANKFV